MKSSGSNISQKPKRVLGLTAIQYVLLALIFLTLPFIKSDIVYRMQKSECLKYQRKIEEVARQNLTRVGELLQYPTDLLLEPKKYSLPLKATECPDIDGQITFDTATGKASCSIHKK